MYFAPSPIQDTAELLHTKGLEGLEAYESTTERSTLVSTERKLLWCAARNFMPSDNSSVSSLQCCEETVWIRLDCMSLK